MGPLVIPIIMGLVSIGQAVAQGAMQSSENNKNKEEMRSLAAIQRKDDLKRNRNNNMLTQNSLDLAQQKNDFNKQMSNMNIKEMDKQKSYLEGTTNQDYLKGMSSRLLGPESRLGNTRRFI